MATGLPYRRVIRIAKAAGFRPGRKGEGFHIHRLLDLLGYEYEETDVIEDTHYEGPAIFLIPANDDSEDWHSVVIWRGRIYDPSICRPVSVGYVIKTASHMYSEIRANE